MAIHVYRSVAYWSETDAAGIVHFSNFFRYCERAEEDFWLSRYGLSSGVGAESNILFPRVRAGCIYHYPIYPYDRYRVEIVDVLVGEKSIQYSHRIYNESRGGVLSAECEVIAVCIDRESFRSIPIPEEIRRFLFENGARPK